MGGHVLKLQRTSPNYTLFTEVVWPVSLYVVIAYEFFWVYLPAAYDLKLVIDKGVVDVLKPSWITASIELGEKAPLRKK